MDPRERRRKQLSRHVVERVERDDRVERPRIELERGEVRLDELGFRDRGSGAAHLLGGDVDAGHLESRGEALRVGHAGTATELEHARAVLQPRYELVLPLAARIAHDLVAPAREALADHVVASADELCPRIGHARLCSDREVDEGSSMQKRLGHALQDASAATADENQRRVEGVFAELDENKPDNVSYIVLRLADDSFVHVSFHDHGDDEVNPIASTAAFAHFQDDHAGRREGPVDQQTAELVGVYITKID